MIKSKRPGWILLLVSLLAQPAFANPPIPKGAEALADNASSINWGELWQDVVEFFGGGNQPSQWSDVKSWKAVGGRFASAYGDDGSLLAIYDLSYPSLFHGISLGQLGNRQIGPDALMQAWNNARATATGIPAYIVDAIDALGSIPRDVMGNDLFPDGWWQQVPWKNGSFLAAGQPQEFRITDFDLSKLNLGAPLISSLRELFAAVVDSEDVVAGLSDDDVLGSFRFVLAPQGGYEVTWDFPTRACETVSHPRKLIDLKNTRGEMYSDIRFEALEAGLSEAAELIPVPVVQAAVATAISRLAHYYQMTQVEHLEMLHELILDGSDSVLQSLSDGDRNNVVEAFEFTRTTPDDGWEWIFGSAQAAWDKDQANDAACSDASITWLTSHGDSLTELSPAYLLAQDSSANRYLYLASQQMPTGVVGPVLSLDYQHPDAVVAARYFMEAVDVGVEFACHFVPTFGQLVHSGYNYLIENQIDSTQYWEARLTQQIEQRSDASLWQNELQMLENQRINPFEISRSEMNQLIAERRTLLGL